jgi:hypothetical protein
MAKLTPQQAADMIHRSMLTGVPTAEFDAAGGYDAVYSLAQSSGADMGRPSDSAILRYGPTIEKQGYGNMSYAPGADLGGRDSALADAGYDNYYEQAQDNTVKSSPAYTALQQQLSALTQQFNTLKSQRSGGTASVGTANNSGGAPVDTNASTFMQNAGQGYANSGAVWGPDGRMYSSAAAAIAAGVTNFSTTRPALSSSAANPNTAGGGLIESSLNQPISTKNPFALGGPFSTQTARVGLPGGVQSPFQA